MPCDTISYYFEGSKNVNEKLLIYLANFMAKSKILKKNHTINIASSYHKFYFHKATQIAIDFRKPVVAVKWSQNPDLQSLSARRFVYMIRQTT